MNAKILPASKLAGVCSGLRRRKKKIVFTNGTFDILHLGHITYLQKAKALGNVLIVGVNSDESVRSYKSPDRPVNPEKDRMAVLAALACVDFVVLFTDPTPIKLIRLARPDILAKGADWEKSKIAGAADVESWGGKVKRIKLVPGRSTTHIIHKMRAGVTCDGAGH